MAARTRAMVSHARGPEFRSALGVTSPVSQQTCVSWGYTMARQQVSSRLTVSLDTGLLHPLRWDSADNAFYLRWGPDVLLNERQLTGGV